MIRKSGERRDSKRKNTVSVQCVSLYRSSHVPRCACVLRCFFALLLCCLVLIRRSAILIVRSTLISQCQTIGQQHDTHTKRGTHQHTTKTHMRCTYNTTNEQDTWRVHRMSSSGVPSEMMPCLTSLLYYLYLYTALCTPFYIHRYALSSSHRDGSSRSTNG